MFPSSYQEIRASLREHSHRHASQISGMRHPSCDEEPLPRAVDRPQGHRDEHVDDMIGG